MERCLTANYLYKKRVTYAVLSTCLLQILFLFLVLCCAYFDPWHPFHLVSTAMDNFLSLRVWRNLIVFGLLITVQCLLYSQNFVSERKIASSRFSLLSILFSFNYWLMLNLHMVIWGTVFWLKLQLFDIYFEDLEEECVSEERIFLLASGVWFGAYFLIFDCRNVQKPSPRYLQFPVLHQLKFLQVKMSLFPIFKQSVVDAVSPLFVFFVFYLWKGNALKEVVYEYRDMVSSTLCKDMSYGVWSVGTICMTWLFYSVAFNIVYSMKLLFKVYFTEYHKFPVTAPFDSSSSPTLHDALSSSNPVVVQLAYLDLRVLAEKDRPRQDELFTLSQLGGHPHNWNAVFETSLKMIKDFSDRLKVAISEEPKIAPPVCRTEESAAKPEVSTSYKSVMRNLSPGRYGPMPHDPLNTTVLAPASDEKLFDVVARRVKAALNNLLKRPGVKYIFGERIELNVHHVMSQAQLVMWAMEGLSLLTASSVLLDKYGVALKDLPVLITSLLDLKQVLDRLQKMSVLKKELRSYQADVKTRMSLQASVKRSLYRLTVAFKNHINDLPVTSTVRAQLKPFVHFREG